MSSRLPQRDSDLPSGFFMVTRASFFGKNRKNSIAHPSILFQTENKTETKERAVTRTFFPVSARCGGESRPRRTAPFIFTYIQRKETT